MNMHCLHNVLQFWRISHFLKCCQFERWYDKSLLGVITKGAHMRPAYKVACPQGMICQVLTSTIQGTIIGSENRLEIHSLRNKGLAFIVKSFFQVKITYSALFVKILLELLIQLFCLVAFDCWEQPMLLGILWQNAQNMMEPLWCLFTRVKNRWNLKEKLVRRGVEFHKREGSQLKSVNWHES